MNHIMLDLETMGTGPNAAIKRTVIHHNALDDAISQAKHLIAMLTPAVGGPEQS